MPRIKKVMQVIQVIRIERSLAGEARHVYAVHIRIRFIPVALCYGFRVRELIPSLCFNGMDKN